MSEYRYQCVVGGNDAMEVAFGITSVFFTVCECDSDSEGYAGVSLSHDDAKDLGERLINWAEMNG